MKHDTKISILSVIFVLVFEVLLFLTVSNDYNSNVNNDYNSKMNFCNQNGFDVYQSTGGYANRNFCVNTTSHETKEFIITNGGFGGWVK